MQRFEYVNIKHIPRLKNQEANDFDKIASGYKVFKEKLEDLIEVQGRVLETKLSPLYLDVTKLGYADEENFENFSIDNLTDAD